MSDCNVTKQQTTQIPSRAGNCFGGLFIYYKETDDVSKTVEYISQFIREDRTNSKRVFRITESKEHVGYIENKIIRDVLTKDRNIFLNQCIQNKTVFQMCDAKLQNAINNEEDKNHCKPTEKGYYCTYSTHFISGFRGAEKNNQHGTFTHSNALYVLDVHNEGMNSVKTFIQCVLIPAVMMYNAKFIINVYDMMEEDIEELLMLSLQIQSWYVKCLEYNDPNIPELNLND